MNLPYEFKSMALPNGKVAPWLAKKGTKYIPGIDIDITYMYWNMKDPVWGGYTPERVALRRAMSLAYDMDTEIYLVRNGSAIAAYRGLVFPRRIPAASCGKRVSNWRRSTRPPRSRRGALLRRKPGACSTISASLPGTHG